MLHASANTFAAPSLQISSELGKVTVLFWNPYNAAKGLLDGTEQDFISEYKITCSGVEDGVELRL